MTYRLYGGRQTGSMAIEAALEEIGGVYDLVPVDREAGEHLEAAFTAVNPRQQVPALVLGDGTVVTEGPAILVHLADAHPAAGLIPAPGTPARATHDRWLAFFHANVYEGALREFYPDRYTTDPAGAEAVATAATAYVRQHYKILDGQMGAGPYLLGDRLSMADIYIWMLCYWVDEAWLQAECPRASRLKAAGDARPKLAAVRDRHFG